MMKLLLVEFVQDDAKPKELLLRKSSNFAPRIKINP